MKLKYKLIESFFNLKPFVNKKNKFTYDLKLNAFQIPIKVDKLKGMKILFLSDLHLDIVPEFTDKLIEVLRYTEYDFVFLGGDYLENSKSIRDDAIRIKFEFILDSIPEGKAFAVLGNHDDVHVQKFLNQHSVTVLNNESYEIFYNNFKFNCYGLNYFYPGVNSINNEDTFSILLSHDPDLFFVGEQFNFDFQLSGHSHNGQIQFPKGFAPKKNTQYGKRFLNGFWREGDLLGYTTSGVGCSVIPVRYNTQAEVVLFEFI